MEEFTLQELSYFLVMLLGGIGGLAHVIQRSRCTKINCCGVSCTRDIKNMTEEKEKENNLELLDQMENKI
jgi:hypothetical protein